MRRNILYTLGIVALATLTGCSLFRKQPETTTTGAGYPYGQFATSETPSYPVADPFPAYDSETTAYTPDPVDISPATSASPVALSAAAERIHTVARRETLYSIARTYYGDHHRWKAIYQANRDAISNPNMIRVGQRLVIPQ